MRTFIILLLLTNLAYFGWYRGWLGGARPAAPPVAAAVHSDPGLPPFEPAAQTLALLSELSDVQRQALGLPSTAAQPPDALPMAGVDEAANVDPAAAPPAPTGTTRPWCAELGPFATPDEAQAMQPALSALGVGTAIRERQVAVSSTFWVYLPPFDDDAELRRVQSELQARGIDHYYMRSGQFTGGISLGVFSRQSSAEEAQASLALRGYRTRVGEVFREEARSFLQLRMPDATLLELPAWQEFRAETGDLGLAENVCESVASDF